MAAFLAKIISKKILGERLENAFGKEDPYFETLPATRLDGKQSKTKLKKRRKALPPGISEHDGRVLTKVKRRAYRLDMALFSFAGLHFGWGTVIGFIPGIGDVIDAFMAMMVLRTCQQVEGGLPASVKSKMMVNIVVDFAIGLVPFVGDLVDAAFKANTKNAVVLESYLREKGVKNLKAQGRVSTLDPTDPDTFDKLEEQTTPPSSNLPSRQPSRRQDHGPVPTRDPVVEERQGGWFSKSKTKQPDIERGDRRREDGPLPRLPNEAVVRDEPRRHKSTKSTLQKNRH
jgi:hypothetical protein